MRQIIKRLREELAGAVCSGEIDAITRILATDLLQIGETAYFLRDKVELTGEQESELADAIQRLKKNEPLQYILGETEFCGLRLKVNPSVLIPRPETGELVRLIASENNNCSKRILDIGTGSGCIAIALAKELPQSTVSAWDISEEALIVAKENSIICNTNISFAQRDILTYTPAEADKFDIIVSNPPYIKEEEKSQMESNVLDWEPSLALFVPDNDPLLFYRTIAEKAKTMLTTDGQLYFEINREHGTDTCTMLTELGYTNIHLHKDFAGNDRMVSARI
ncbi:MAG: peptide chain release factor N(5)-glutamine methyltransferase [Bacteroidales bacterium]|nr:peptide chain release factor N(5)-glutamine methyltransferase [Bacteroidales bacterium]